MTRSPRLSVIVPAHNPNAARLRRTLAGLSAQSLAAGEWETILVDNASHPPIAIDEVQSVAPVNLRVVREPALGLSAARRRGCAESQAPIVVLVDDDNVLAPDYLAHVLKRLGEQPRIGAVGGKSLPEFERAPEEWTGEFLDLIACRDQGDRPIVSNGLWDKTVGRNVYPRCAPIGAGMAVRRAAIATWLSNGHGDLSDRRGRDLSSGGDNDIVFTVMKAGWQVAYFPELSLTHLIPVERTERDYLGRLNRGIQRTWQQVLRKHDASPWGAVAGWTIPLRQLKAWFTYRAWTDPASFVRWQGACGHFEGRRR